MSFRSSLPGKIVRIAGTVVAIALLWVPSAAYGEEIQNPAPAVQLTSVNVSLVENYNQDYALYEESLQGAYYLYCNVYNGAITSDPVSLDIPANLTYSLEKDGVAYAYTPNSQLTELGNYVLRVNMIEGNISYASTFRFSIRKPKPAEETIAPVEPEVTGEPTPEETIPEETTPIDYEITSKWTKGPLFLSDYTYAIGSYTYCLIGNEVTINSNVPNGITTNGKVNLSIPEGIEYTVYLNDEECEQADSFEADGNYRIEFQNSSQEFHDIYGSLIPTFQFRIVNGPVKDMRYYNLPKGFVLTAISIDGNSVDMTTLDQYSYYPMDKDGNYTFTFISLTTNESFTVSISRDTNGPKFGLLIENQKATISFVTNDQAKTVLYKDGVKVSEGMLTSVSGKGEYYYEAYDYAGNMSSMQFTLGKSINGGTIWSILFVLLFIGGAVYVVMSSKKNLHVR